MFKEITTSYRYYHEAYVRRREPTEERLRRELRRAIGLSLIHLGERLAGSEATIQLDEAA